VARQKYRKRFFNNLFTPFCLIKKVPKKSRLPGSFHIFYGLLTHAQQQLDPLRRSQTFAAQGLSELTSLENHLKLPEAI
jgi:hypothetical protein